MEKKFLICFLVTFSIMGPKAGALDILGSIKGAVEESKAKGQQISQTVMKIYDHVQDRLRNFQFNERYLQFTIPIFGKELGFEYDLGFEGAGDIEKGFSPVVAMFAPPIEIIPGVSIPISGKRFLNIVGKILKIIPIIGPLIRKKVIEPAKNMMRWRPESVFVVRMLSLVSSVSNKQIKLTDMHKHLVTLLSRLMISVNEAATIVANRGETEPKKWIKKILFKDTGIDDIFEKKFLTIVKKVFDSIDMKITKQEKDEFDERKDQKVPTALEKKLGIMYTIPEYSKRTAYIIEEVLPLAGTNMDNTDKRKFVTAVTSHANNSYKGVLSVFKVKLMPDLLADEDEEEGEEDLENADEIANQLAINKEKIKTRLPFVVKMLKQAEAKMAGKFSPKHVKRVSGISIRIDGIIKKLIPITKKITWDPDLKPDETIDSMGADESLSDFPIPA